MHTPLVVHPLPRRPSVSSLGIRIGALVLPSLLLLSGSLHYSGEASVVLLCGAALQLLLCAVGLFSQNVARRSLGPLLLLAYGIAFAWMKLGVRGSEDWFAHLAQAVLLVIPLTYFGVQTLRDIGAPALRRARLLAQRVAARNEWPADLEACKSLPEVKALREALYLDAAPALQLLSHPRPQVQLAALAALDFRKHWRPGQAEVVLELVLRAEEPAVRAAALNALANLEDRCLIESLGEFLRDPSPLVRRAATESLLWDTEHRWPWIRHAVRRSLGDPLCQEDGALRHSGTLLTGEAVDDLTAWAGEKGLLGMRAALSLGAHYAQALNETTDPDLVLTLKEQLSDPHAPPVLRMELARLLQVHGLLQTDLLHRLLDPANPAPLRLIAVETLLAEGDSPEARAALRELARLPNREIALATADVVQRRLKVELGLVNGQPLPPIHSRQATEIGRRVRSWAAQYDLADQPEDAPSPRPSSRVDTRKWQTLGEV